MMIGGHRGFGCTDSAHAQSLPITRDKPIENTAQSIEKAFRAGASFVEFDIVKTKDNHVVVVHSNRLSDHFFIPLNKEFVAELMLAELRALPMGIGGKGRLSTLPEILDTVQTVADFSKDFILNIEIKDVKDALSQSPKHIEGQPSLIELCLKIIEEKNFPFDKILFSSFSYIDLVQVKKQKPFARCAALFEVGEIPERLMYPQQNLDAERYLHFTKTNIEMILNAVEIEAVHPYFHDITEDLIVFCAEKKLSINAWFYKEALPEENKEKILSIIALCQEHGVSFNIMTDYIPEMKVALSL